MPGTAASQRKKLSEIIDKIKHITKRQGTATPVGMWRIGKLAGEADEISPGHKTYGKRYMATIAEGTGLSPRTLYNARKIHEAFSWGEIRKLSGLDHIKPTHLRELVRIRDNDVRTKVLKRLEKERLSAQEILAEAKKYNKSIERGNIGLARTAIRTAR